MVKLNKIYTRTGDDGSTGLVDGSRLSKNSERVSAYGDIDETNSVIGIARLHVQNVALDQMLARVDIVSVHCPSTPGTFHLLSARRLALMKPGAYIVNTARGGIIDEDALIQALQDGKLSGAGLDVFEHEPAVDKRLRKLAEHHRVVLLPHMGSATVEGRIDMGDKVIINIRTFFDGHRPPDRVIPGRL